MSDQAGLTVDNDSIHCTGYWTAQNLANGAELLDSTNIDRPSVQVDLRCVQEIDTVGALLISRKIKSLELANKSVELFALNDKVKQLIAVVAEHDQPAKNLPAPSTAGLLNTVGEHAVTHGRNQLGSLAFVGEISTALLQAIVRPSRVRFTQIVKAIELDGVRALPIVGLLSFLLGIVIAYQGGVVLRDYGATLYMADIVGLSMVRELAPLITAIIVAGRTGSAYTAQIGTMNVTQEVDAMRSIGISPMEMLVLPKLIAMLIALPLLTVFADLMGIAGGVFMSKAMLGLSPATFIDRLSEALTLEAVLTGVGKAPVFAFIITSVGCYQGLLAKGGAISVGKHTTTSVVQSIFLVLVVDAAFSIAFSTLGL